MGRLVLGAREERGDLTQQRTTAKIWLDEAQQAAAAGDEGSCWNYVGLAELIASP